MVYNPTILDQALSARSLSWEELSKRLDIEQSVLIAELHREPEPQQKILNKIANELAVPVFTFFMSELPNIEVGLPDFRSANSSPKAKSRRTLEVIQTAYAIQKAVIEASSSIVDNLPYFTLDDGDQIEEIARRARQYFALTLQDQINAKDARSFYTVCRKRIEDKGIFVLHDTFPDEDGSGFCLAHLAAPVIVVNTKKQTRGRRLFTLIHELAHVLLMKSGHSDPFVRSNVIERICNKFAGAFLLPHHYVHELLGMYVGISDPSIDDVARIARKLKISHQATVLRLEQIGIFKAGSHNKWLQAIHNIGNPDFSEKGGGGGQPPPQEKVKLAKYGFLFAKAFGSMLNDGSIDEIETYRLSGIKPKYLKPYIDFVASLNEGQLQSLELEDE